MSCIWPHLTPWSVCSMRNYMWNTASGWLTLGKGQSCWKWPQKALSKLAISLNAPHVSPFSSSSVCHSSGGRNAPYKISAPVTLPKHQKYLPLVWVWLFTATGVCRVSTLVKKTPTVIDKWGDYHQKHHPKEGKKAAKCWRNLAVKWQLSCRIWVSPVNCCDLLLRQLKVSKKEICFVQWKIKALQGCNTVFLITHVCKVRLKHHNFIWKAVLMKEGCLGKWEKKSLFRIPVI